VEDKLKEATIGQYKWTVTQIDDFKAAINALVPQRDTLAATIKAFGWDKDVDMVEAGDDFANFPDAAKTKAQQIEQVAKDLFTGNGNQWTRLGDIFLYLTGRGLKIGGRNTNSTLSAHLSNSDLFESDRTQGWRIKPEHFQAMESGK
jgi:hypothetical protein